MTDSISVSEFNRLTPDEKAWYLWHGATFLHVYEKYPFRINLFHLNDYYIELWYHMDGNCIEKINAFTSLENLDPFLANIEIDMVMQRG